jgi:hypothetical protein
MAIKYDVICKNGSYTDKTGAEKTKWMKAGVCMETKQGGLAIKLESLPVGFDGWLTLSEPREKDNFKPRGNDEMPKHRIQDDDLGNVPF